MMYQSEEDGRSERRIADILEAELGFTILTTEKGASIDYMMYRDGIVCGIGECKVRKNRYSYERMIELGDIMLDLSKWKIARFVSKKLMVNFYFVVELTNALLYLEVRWNRDFDPETKIMRLNVVRDVNDRDEVVLLPIEKFTVIKHDPQTIPAAVA
jgi:hypothetical protein